jgi:hypothetical protein
VKEKLIITAEIQHKSLLLKPLVTSINQLIGVLIAIYQAKLLRDAYIEPNAPIIALLKALNK